MSNNPHLSTEQEEKIYTDFVKDLCTKWEDNERLFEKYDLLSFARLYHSAAQREKGKGADNLFDNRLDQLVTALAKHSQPTERKGKGVQTPEEILNANPDLLHLPQFFNLHAVVAAMHEYAPQFEQKWISEKTPPKESGRYWCYLDEVNDLGIAHYQWNCSYSVEDNSWGGTDGNRVRFWTALLNPPTPQQ